jgi:hypothetical protein
VRGVKVYALAGVRAYGVLSFEGSRFQSSAHPPESVGGATSAVVIQLSGEDAAW